MRNGDSRPGAARILLGLMALAAAAAAVQPAGNYDLGWHLAAGRLILQEKAVPAMDPFSFTRGGTPWLDHEWLFQILVFGLHRLCGWWVLPGLVMALAVGTTLLIAAPLERRLVDQGLTGLLIALALTGARFRFDVRPEMASYLFLALLLFVLQSSREPASPRRAVWLFPLFTVWANVHPGVVLGIAVLLLWTAGETLEDRFIRSPGRDGGGRRALILLAPLATLLNPGGWRLFEVPWKLRRIVESGHAPNLEWAPPLGRDFPLFFLSIVLAVLILALGFRRISLPPALTLALSAFLALQQLRNIGFFFLLLPAALGPPLSDLMDRARLPRELRLFVGGGVLLGVSLLFVGRKPPLTEEAYLKSVEARGAVTFLEQHRLGDRLFNDVKFGGYLIWARYPEHRVFIDGRNEVYDSLLAEIFDALGNWEKWEALLARYSIDAALLRRGQMQAVVYPPESAGRPGQREMRAFSAAYFQASRWALVYWDDQALVFVRRSDPNSRSVLDQEYHLVNPDDLPHLVSEIRRGKASLPQARAEVDRRLREDPSCRTARRIRAELMALAPSISR